MGSVKDVTKISWYVPFPPPHHTHKYQFEDKRNLDLLSCRWKSWGTSASPQYLLQLLAETLPRDGYCIPAVSWICTQVDLRDHSVLFGRWLWPAAYLSIHLGYPCSGQVEVKGRAFKSRLGPWRNFEGNLANNLYRRDFYKCNLFGLCLSPPTPCTSPLTLGVEMERVSVLLQFFSGENFYSLNPRPKCGERRKISLLLALKMSLKSATCLLSGWVMDVHEIKQMS